MTAATIAQAMGEPIRDGQNWGMSVTEKFSDLFNGQKLNNGAEREAIMKKYGYGVTGDQAAMNRELAAADERARQGYIGWKSKQWFYGGQDQGLELGDLVAHQTDNAVTRAQGRSLGAMVSQSTGLSYGALTSDAGVNLIAQLGLNPDQNMQARYSAALQMARSSGMQLGRHRLHGCHLKDD